VEQERWQLAGSGPDSYEKYQVPSVFEPLARMLLQRVTIRPGQHVLDVACGTGVLARKAAPILGPSGFMMCVDLNAKMLEIAHRCAPDGGARLEWKQGDATSLPCADAAFDVVLCQQGLQFFPDKTGALREMHRVLKPGGQVGVSVWSIVEHSPCSLAIAEALRRHVGAEVAQRYLAPFSFGDSAELYASMNHAQFRQVKVETAVIMRRLLPPMESIPGLLASTPVGPEIAALAQGIRDLIVDEVATAMSRYRDDDGLTVPQETNMAFGTK
jgi:ubiquinone/menaquinone biosynthesis C-methylase UbiE